MGCKDEVTALRKFGDFAEFYENQDTDTMTRMLAFIQDKFPFVCMSVGDFDGAPKRQGPFTVVLDNRLYRDFGAKHHGKDYGHKIHLIKEVRGITRIGLKEAKDLVEGSADKVMIVMNTPDSEVADEAVNRINIVAGFICARIE